jgi:hypothetical protein
VAGGGTAKPVFPFGGEARPNDDRMKVLASLVAGKGSHRQVAKALVNRIWAWLLGRGIVHPVDDFNKRTLAEARTVLLEKLANGLIDNKFSIKFLIRTICSTKLYQRADVAPPDGSTEVYWHGALVRNVMPKPPPLPKDLISFEVPGAWAGVNRSSGGKAQFAVPDKDRKARDAELAVFQISGAAAVKTQIERWGRQMADLKSTSQAVDGGKGKITLHVHSGTYTCDRTSDGPSDDRMLVGIVETGGETWAFRFVGSAPVVDGWRDEFLTLLKGARK